MSIFGWSGLLFIPLNGWILLHLHLHLAVWISVPSHAIGLFSTGISDTNISRYSIYYITTELLTYYAYTSTDQGKLARIQYWACNVRTYVRTYVHDLLFVSLCLYLNYWGQSFLRENSMQYCLANSSFTSWCSKQKSMQRNPRKTENYPDFFRASFCSLVQSELTKKAGSVIE